MLDHRVVDTEDGENLPLSRLSYLEKIVWRQNGGESTPLTIKHDRLEGRVVSIEKTQSAQTKLLVAILLLALSTLTGIITVLVTRPIPQVSQHTYIQ